MNRSRREGVEATKHFAKARTSRVIIIPFSSGWQAEVLNGISHFRFGDNMELALRFRSIWHFASSISTTNPPGPISHARKRRLGTKVPFASFGFSGAGRFWPTTGPTPRVARCSRVTGPKGPLKVEGTLLYRKQVPSLAHAVSTMLECT